MKFAQKSEPLGLYFRLFPTPHATTGTALLESSTALPEPGGSLPVGIADSSTPFSFDNIHEPSSILPLQLRVTLQGLLRAASHRHARRQPGSPDAFALYGFCPQP